MTNDVKCRDTDYIDFIIASPKLFSCTEAAKVQPESLHPPAHDAFTRLLHRLEPDPEALWQEARPLVQRLQATGWQEDEIRDLCRQHGIPFRPAKRGS